MKSTYKAVEVYEPGKLRVVERQVSEPGAGQVRIRVEACGICHTDAATVLGAYPGLTLPRVPGHEVVGRGAGRWWTWPSGYPVCAAHGIPYGRDRARTRQGKAGERLGRARLHRYCGRRCRSGAAAYGRGESDSCNRNQW